MRPGSKRLYPTPLTRSALKSSDAAAVRGPVPRRGEVWTANLGDPPSRHWVVIVSLDARNASERINSVLIVPFGSSGYQGPTTLRLEPGETGLPASSYIKGHFITTLAKDRLLRRDGRVLSSS